MNPAIVIPGSSELWVSGQVPHGAAHTLAWQPGSEAETHAHPGPNSPTHSAVVAHSTESPHRALLKQRHGPSTVSPQWQLLVAGPQSAPSPHRARPGHGASQRGEPACANAGIRRLVSTGADQAIAAPAPMRRSIRRREIVFGRSSGSISHPPISMGSLNEPIRTDATMPGYHPPRHRADAVKFLRLQRLGDVGFLRSGPPMSSERARGTQQRTFASVRGERSSKPSFRLP